MEEVPARGEATARATAERESLAVALDGVQITIRSEVSGMLPWLHEILVPGFTALAEDAGAAGADGRFVIVDEGAPLRVVIASGTANEGLAFESTYPCFASDREVVRLPGRFTGTSIVLEDELWGARYDVDRTRVVVSPSRPAARLRVAALRAVRELASVRALAAGGRVQLHASCVAWEGRCVVLAGPKGAGKTTLLARLAASTGAGIVANDRVLVRPTENGWHVTGVPTIVRVRPGTMRCMPDLFRTVPAVARPVDLTLHEAELAASRLGTVKEPSRLSLSPAQLAREVGSTLSPGAPLACAAVIDVDPGAGEFCVKRMSRAEAADAVRNARFGASAPLDAPTVFERVAGRGLERVSEEYPVRDLSAADWVRIGVGERFLSSPTAPERLLRTVFAGG